MTIYPLVDRHMGPFISPGAGQTPRWESTRILVSHGGTSMFVFVHGWTNAVCVVASYGQTASNDTATQQ